MANVTVWATVMYRCETCAFWSLGNTDESLNRIERHLATKPAPPKSRPGAHLGHDGHWFTLFRAQVAR